jgi:hypothetical protein
LLLLVLRLLLLHQEGLQGVTGITPRQDQQQRQQQLLMLQRQLPALVLLPLSRLRCQQ